MKILALILAREGSKRLLGKNIKNFVKKPLIAWRANIVNLIPKFYEVLLSTDNSLIKKTTIKYVAYVPCLCPAQLSQGQLTSADSFILAIDFFEFKYGNVDSFLSLQPTSPFWNINKMRVGVERFLKRNRCAFLGATQTGWSESSETEGSRIFFLDKNTKNCIRDLDYYQSLVNI